VTIRVINIYYAKSYTKYKNTMQIQINVQKPNKVSQEKEKKHIGPTQIFNHNLNRKCL